MPLCLNYHYDKKVCLQYVIDYAVCFCTTVSRYILRCSCVFVQCLQSPAGKSVLFLGMDNGVIIFLIFSTPVKGLFEMPFKKTSGSHQVYFQVFMLVLWILHLLFTRRTILNSFFYFSKFSLFVPVLIYFLTPTAIIELLQTLLTILVLPHLYDVIIVFK